MGKSTVSSKEVSSKEVLGNIGSVLFQIHALAKILEKRMIDEEKIEFCLDAIDKNGEQPSEYGNLNAK